MSLEVPSSSKDKKKKKKKKKKKNKGTESEMEPGPPFSSKEKGYGQDVSTSEDIPIEFVHL